MTNPVTVIIPTCDRVANLCRALASVAAQTHPAAEVIVVDNGIVATAVQIADLEYHIVRTEVHVGPARARNIGASAARTPLIAFLDDDDYWYPNYLEEAVAAMASGAGFDVVVGRLNRRDVRGVERRYKLFPEEPERQRETYFRNPGFGGQNTTIRRDVFLKLGGFDERFPASEDRDLAARLLQSGHRIGVAPHAVSVLWDHAGVRARQKQLVGNCLFIAKHWRHMRWRERYAACRVLGKRSLRAVLESAKNARSSVP